MRLVLAQCALALLTLVSGCRLLDDEAMVAGRSPLRPLTPSRDSVQMEVIWARCPLADREINDTMWGEIDETQVEPQVQRELARNGFRVGVVSANPPAAIARVLNMSEAEPPAAENGGLVQTLDLVHDTKLHGSRRNLRRGERMEIRASENLASMPLLIARQGELGGRTIADAQAIYALQIDPLPDQRVEVEVTPEIHFGAAQLRWAGGEQGLDVVLRQQPMREREVFESMRLAVRLAPGEMLILAGLPESGSRPGYYFHTTATAGGREQKIVLIRVAQVPKSDTFESLTAR